MAAQEMIKNVATLENANEYAKTNEKFTYCIDLLEISAHKGYAEDMVNELEDLFEALLSSSK